LLRAEQKNARPTDGQTHIYRLTHPLGEWVVEQAKQQALPEALLVFDYSGYGAKVSAVETLLNQSGILHLQRYSIESLERLEDHLIFAAQTDNGEFLPMETAQKLMQLSAYVVETVVVSTSARLLERLEHERNTIMREVNTRNLGFFEQEVNKLDAWADDLKDSLEDAIHELDKAIKQARRDAKIALTLEEKLVLQKLQKKLEAERNQQRRSLFDQQDAIDARREALIGRLEEKLNKRTVMEDLFTIRWSII
jgi:hypothetical protein